MSGPVDVHLDLDAIHDLGFDDDVVDLAMDVGEGVAEVAAANAPRLTGGGAASIHAVPDQDGQSAYVDVGWDAAHNYLRFAEDGTEKEAARPFLRPAADGAHL